MPVPAVPVTVGIPRIVTLPAVIVVVMPSVAPSTLPTAALAPVPPTVMVAPLPPSSAMPAPVAPVTLPTPAIVMTPPPPLALSDTLMPVPPEMLPPTAESGRQTAPLAADHDAGRAGHCYVDAELARPVAAADPADPGNQNLSRGCGRHIDADGTARHGGDLAGGRRATHRDGAGAAARVDADRATTHRASAADRDVAAAEGYRDAGPGGARDGANTLDRDGAGAVRHRDAVGRTQHVADRRVRCCAANRVVAVGGAERDGGTGRAGDIADARDRDQASADEHHIDAGAARHVADQPGRRHAVGADDDAPRARERHVDAELARPVAAADPADPGNQNLEPWMWSTP